MEPWARRKLQQLRNERKEPLEVKTNGRNHYLYRSTTVWSKEEHKRKKVSRYIGKLTEDGLVEGERTKNYARTVYDYGNARLLLDLSSELIPPLRQAFPDEWLEMLAMGIVRTLRPMPLKVMKDAWERLYLCEELSPSLSPNTLSEKLRQVGSDWESQRAFFAALITGSKQLVFDLSCVFSRSENLRLAEKGHNADHMYLKQINFALFFSLDKGMPVMLRPLPGSVKEFKSIKLLLDEWEFGSAVLVADRGLASYALPSLLRERKMRFVVPLKRNFKVIDYDMELRGCFVYRDRGINWGRRRVKGNYLYLFEDVRLRAEEETTFIEMISEGKRERRDLDEERKRFGRIAILSNIDEDGEQIYLLYKERGEIEVAFDAMKNELEEDKTYLSDDDAVRGHFFVTFISLYLYFRILELLRGAELIGKVSVNELLFNLSKVSLVHHTDGTRRLTEIPAKVERVEKDLGLKLFPIELRS